MRPEARGACIHCSKLEPLIERARMHRTGLAFASMSQNNFTMIYAGIDVAKATLVLSLQDVCHTLENNPTGHARLLQLLGQVGAPIHVILEATGGYESAVVRVLHAASVAVSVMLPSRVRDFARAMGLQAKTDPIDAGLLAAFGAAIQPEPTRPPSEAQRQLTELVIRRAQLVDSKVVEQNRAEHYTDRTTQRQSSKMLDFLEQQITECDRQILRQIKADEVLHARACRLQEVPGVGPVTAATLLAHMPELGTLDDGQAAALAGLAPYNCDSGPFKGTRRIRGGRKEVRCALYMAAMTAVRHDPILRVFYQRLCAAGKKPIVALTAAMRKLILLLNRLLANPNFQLAA
jgi:transposase